MKRVVCIVGGFAPYFSPGGKIAFNVLNELKNDYEIIVIAQKTHFELPQVENIDRIKVIRINEYNRMIHNYLESRIRNSDSKLCKSYYKSLLLLKKTFFYCAGLFRRISISEKYTKEITCILETLESDKHIDVIIPVSAPHEGVIAARRFKEKNSGVTFIPYKLDRFAEGNSLYENIIIRKLRYPKHVAEECKTLEMAYKLFALPPIADYYLTNPRFNKFREKIVKTEHPLLVYEECECGENHTDTIELCYAGSLDQTLRNPDIVFKTFQSVKNFQKKYRFNLYSFGNCQGIIDDYKKILGIGLNDAGRVSSKEIRKILSSTDILISIGNNSKDEVPSKLFEYLSYGKPIVHFYYYETDEYIQYLKNYPFALCLKMRGEEISKNAMLFEQFCTLNKGKKCDFEEIVKNYYECTPKYVSEQFRGFIESSNAWEHSVIVAHPNQQHSMKLAAALKKGGFLHTYITTAFYSDKSYFMNRLAKVLGKNFKSKLDKKRDEYIQDNTIVFCRLRALIFYAMVRINYDCSCILYKKLADRVSMKVAKYAIEKKSTAVVLYDFTATTGFLYLKDNAPHIKRILDMSSIPVLTIDEILTLEEKKGHGEFYKNKRLRYSKNNCLHFEKEIALADYFLVPSDFVKDCLLQQGVDRSQIFIVPYGVSLDDYKYSHHSVKEDEVHFIYVGRIEGAKGILYLLNACKQLAKRGYKFKLHIVGSLNICRSMIDGMPYIVYHGYLGKDELIKLYEKMSVFVLPSLWEGCSLSGLEAISSGIPAIVTNATGIDNVVKEHSCGIVVNSQNSDELEFAMSHFCENPCLVSEMSLNCKMAVAARSWSEYEEEINKVFNQIARN